MKTKLCIYSQPNYLTSRTAIGREQKQFIKIAFAVHLSAVISAERYRSDSGALKSAVLHFVFFVMLKNKIEQSAKRNSLLKKPTDRTFENRWSRYKELGKKVPQAYRVYVEDTFLPCDAGDARIFSKEETGLYYYGARYLDPKYSRWLSGDPALSEYIPQAPVNDEAKKHNENLPGMGGVFNVVNLHVYHYAGNNPVKYTDPDGRTAKYSIDEESTTVTIQVDIVIYGNDATDALAKEYQTGIEAAWGQDSNGNQWQTEINGKQYFVKFDVNVSVGKRPGFFTKLWNAFFGTKNYIKADRNMHRSNVVNGFLGTWRTEGRRTSLSNDNPAAHEFGHLIGFQDRYSDVSGTHLGWEGNIMGEAAMRGCVEQRNIDALGGYISNKGRLRGTIRLRKVKL